MARHHRLWQLKVLCPRTKLLHLFAVLTKYTSLFVINLSSCTVLACSFYVRPQAMNSIFRRAEKFHDDTEFFRQLLLNMRVTTTYYTLVPLVGGFVMATINAMLIYQYFKYGFNPASNTCGFIAIVIISLMLSSGSFCLFCDVSRYPDDKAGTVQDSVYLFIYVMKVALEQDDPMLNGIIHVIHEELECCGINTITDFYNMQQIDYPPDHTKKSRKVSRNTFRISNNWVHRCSMDASVSSNTTRICYAPPFCCRGDTKSVKSGACPPTRWDGVGKLDPPRKMYQHPCAWRLAHNMRDKALNLAIFSAVDVLVAIANAVHMLML